MRGPEQGILWESRTPIRNHEPSRRPNRYTCIDSDLLSFIRCTVLTSATSLPASQSDFLSDPEGQKPWLEKNCVKKDRVSGHRKAHENIMNQLCKCVKVIISSHGTCRNVKLSSLLALQPGQAWVALLPRI